MVCLQECIAGPHFLHIIIGQSLIVKVKWTCHPLQDLHTLIRINHICEVHHKVHIKLHGNDEIAAQRSCQSAHTRLKSCLRIQNLAVAQVGGHLCGQPHIISHL